MNRKLSIALIALAALSIGYNFTKLDLNAPLEGDSSIAAIGMLAATIAIVLVLIVDSSKKVRDKIDGAGE